MPTSSSGALLTDGTVTLRRHTAADVDGIEQSTDEQSQRWTAVRVSTRARMRSRSWSTSPASGRTRKRYWAIEVTAADGSPRFGGTVDLRPGEAWDHASIGFGLHPAARGRGAMSRAVRLVATHAFEIGPWGRPLGRIHWRAIAGNWGSRRGLGRPGSFHGTLPARTPTSWTRPGRHWTVGTPALRPESRCVPGPLGWSQLRWKTGESGSGPSASPTSTPSSSASRPGALVPAAVTPQPRHVRGLAGAPARAHGERLRHRVGHRRRGYRPGTRPLTVFERNGTLTGDVAELGYQLVPSARGKGAAKACRLAISYAFRPKEDGGLGLRRLVAETAADNVASNAAAFRRVHRVRPGACDGSTARRHLR